MKTTQLAHYALKMTYAQVPPRDRAVSRSAVALAALGLGLSSFSVKQMVFSQAKATRRL